MQKLKRTTLTTFVLLGLFVSSGVAIADPVETEVDEEEATDSAVLADTLFSFGYDLINGLLLWNISSIDEPCVLPTEGDLEAEAECELTGGEVAGPNGQINHGMFMKLFNSLYDGNSRGCVNRHLAQSDLGQGDQQVKVGDEGEDTDDTAPIDFTTVEADCEKGGDDTGLEAGNGNGNGNGKPANAGKPESPGKSASAPGKNK